MWFLLVCLLNIKLDFIKASAIHGIDTQKLLSSTAECVKQNLLNGSEILGWPSFNPLEIDEFVVDLNNITNIDGDLLITDLLLEGLPEFYFSDAFLDLSVVPVRATLEGTFHVDKIVATFNYEGDTSAFDFFPIFGRGQARLEVTSIRIPLFAVIGLEIIEDVNLGFYLGNVKISISGLQESEKVSHGASIQLVNIIKQVFEEYQREVNQYFQTFALDYIGTKNMADLLNLFDDLGNSCET